MKQYLAVGEILKPQGVRGELKLKPLTNDISRFEWLEDAYLEENGAYTPVRMAFVRYGDDAVYMRMDGVDDRNAAELLRGRLVYVDRAHAVELNENQHFIEDLIGLRGVDTDGNELGELTEVMQPGGNDVYVFRNRRARRETLVPALKSVILRVDLDAGVITLDAARLAEVAVSDEF